jgi:hypothetical protein
MSSLCRLFAFESYEAWVGSAARLLRAATQEEKCSELGLPELLTWKQHSTMISTLPSDSDQGVNVPNPKLSSNLREEVLRRTTPASLSDPGYDGWSYLSLRNKDSASGYPRMYYASHHTRADEFLKSLKGNVFGFDMEWVNPRGRVSVIQVCDLERIVIVHLAKMDSKFHLQRTKCSPPFRRIS